MGKPTEAALAQTWEKIIVVAPTAATSKRSSNAARDRMCDWLAADESVRSKAARFLSTKLQDLDHRTIAVMLLQARWMLEVGDTCLRDVFDATVASVREPPGAYDSERVIISKLCLVVPGLLADVVAMLDAPEPARRALAAGALCDPLLVGAHHGVAALRRCSRDLDPRVSEPAKMALEQRADFDEHVRRG